MAWRDGVGQHALKGVDKRATGGERTSKADVYLDDMQAPVGGEEAARVLKEVGERRELGFEARDHLSIGTALDLIDFDTGAAVAGAKCVPCPVAILARSLQPAEVSYSSAPLQPHLL